MNQVSFHKATAGHYKIGVARNGFPMKHAGDIRKQGPFFVVTLKAEGEYVPCATFAAAKTHARTFFRDGEV